MGDLVNCTEVLYNYLEGNETVPWEDLRYMFGEVFYGGHITDPMDRKLCIGYLDVLVKPDLLPGADGSPPTNILAPGFKAPPPESYQSLRDYVEAALPPETPALYGLHSNAQLSLLTTEGEILFETVLTVKGGGGGGAGGGSNEAMVRSAVEDMLERLPEPFNFVDIESRIVDKNPYVVCALQEVSQNHTNTHSRGLPSRMRVDTLLKRRVVGLVGSVSLTPPPPLRKAVSSGFLTRGTPGAPCR